MIRAQMRPLLYRILMSSLWILIFSSAGQVSANTEFSFRSCVHIDFSSYQGLVIINSDQLALTGSRSVGQINSWLLDLQKYDELTVAACTLSANNVDYSELKEKLSRAQDLKAIVLLGDFFAPSVQADEELFSQLGAATRQLSPSYYYLSDFTNTYQAIDKNKFVCEGCNHEQILKASRFRIGSIRSFDLDAKDLHRYLARVAAHRRGLDFYTNELVTVRSGFDPLGVFQLFDDRDGQGSYQKLAKFMGLKLQSWLPKSSDLAFKKLERGKIEDLKKIARTEFKRPAKIASVIMHGNDQFAGGNSRVGPFIDAGDGAHLVGGAQFTLFHSCRAGKELAPKSLVYSGDQGESLRLAVLASLTDTHRLSVLPGNLLLMKANVALSDVGFGVTNFIDQTFFGDPFLKTSYAGLPAITFSEYMAWASGLSGGLVGPTHLARASQALESRADLADLLEWIGPGFGAGFTANTFYLYLSQEELALYDEKALVFGLTHSHPLVRRVTKKALFKRGMAGIEIFDKLNNQLSQSSQFGRYLDEEDQDALLVPGL